jgi:hypothetical protein
LADLAQLLGSLLASLARARQEADLESALIAEEYQRHPLLAGLGAPRIRVCEMEAEFPFAVTDVTPSTPGLMVSAGDLAAALAEVVRETAASAGLILEATSINIISERLSSSLEHLTEQWRSAGPRLMPSESVSRRAQQVVKEVLSLRDPPTESSAMRAILDAVRERTYALTNTRDRRAPTVSVQFATSEIKELPPGAVTRVRLLVKEEGLEWTSRWTELGRRQDLSPE